VTKTQSRPRIQQIGFLRRHGGTGGNTEGARCSPHERRITYRIGSCHQEERARARGEGVEPVTELIFEAVSNGRGPRQPETARQISRGQPAEQFEQRKRVAVGLSDDAVTLLLVHGWPQTWYAWRLVMPALARDFAVVAPDQRGCGLSGKPEDGYDTATLAGDLVALMDALGHRRFAVAGHDTGMWIGYALAADHPRRVARLAVAETPLPGVSLSPPLFANAHLNDALWHFAFNRLAEVNDQLITGREEIYFGWQFATKAARPLPDHAVRHYVDTFAADPTALHASFAIYRSLDATIAQNQQRKTRRLTLPVLGIGGAKSLGDQVAATMKLAADDVQILVIPGCGHHPPEEAPEETLAALTMFLAPYRDEYAAVIH
jgi:pimeloyl-ACP methyl ester carboxylesterase